MDKIIFTLKNNTRIFRSIFFLSFFITDRIDLIPQLFTNELLESRFHYTFKEINHKKIWNSELIKIIWCPGLSQVMISKNNTVVRNFTPIKMDFLISMI